jgi:hypothetical protein
MRLQVFFGAAVGPIILSEGFFPVTKTMDNESPSSPLKRIMLEQNRLITEFRL